MSNNAIAQRTTTITFRYLHSSELAVGRCCVRGQVSIFGRKENLLISQIKLVAFQVIYDVDIFFEWKLFLML